MKRVSFCLTGKVFMLLVCLSLTPFYIWALDYFIEGHTAENNSSFVTLICFFSLFYVGCTITFSYYFIWLSGSMRLYKDKIERRMRITRKYYTILVAEIHEIVIQCEPILSKKSDLSLRINSSKGLLLAYGRTALRALLRTYPNMKFRVKYTGYLLGRKNAILLSQRGYLGVHKRRAVAKLFHIREEKLTPIEKSNSTDE